MRDAVSNVVCEDLEAHQRSWRCSFDVKQTRWMEGEQIDEVELKKLTRTFDAVSVIAEKGNRETPSVIWIERAPE